MLIRTTLGTAVIAVLLTACGSAKDANKSNFSKAIDQHFATTCIVLDPGIRSVFGGADYPITVTLNEANQFTNADKLKQQNDALTAPYQALVKAGLLTVADGHGRPQVGFSLSGSDTRQTPGKIYSLTDDGKKALADQKNLRGTAFCAGHYKVDDIVRFTPPAAMMGPTLSSVTYTYSASDVPSWVKSDDINRAFPDLAKQLADQQQAGTDLMLTNDGWIVASDFDK